MTANEATANRSVIAASTRPSGASRPMATGRSWSTCSTPTCPRRRRHRQRHRSQSRHRNKHRTIRVRGGRRRSRNPVAAVFDDAPSAGSNGRRDGLACSTPEVPRIGAVTMATYIALSRFTDQGIRSIKDTTKRADAAKEAAKEIRRQHDAYLLDAGTLRPGDDHRSIGRAGGHRTDADHESAGNIRTETCAPSTRTMGQIWPKCRSPNSHASSSATRRARTSAHSGGCLLSDPFFSAHEGPRHSWA